MNISLIGNLKSYFPRTSKTGALSWAAQPFWHFYCQHFSTPSGGNLQQKSGQRRRMDWGELNPVAEGMSWQIVFPVSPRPYMCMYILSAKSLRGTVYIYSQARSRSKARFCHQQLQLTFYTFTSNAFAGGGASNQRKIQTDRHLHSVRWYGAMDAPRLAELKRYKCILGMLLLRVWHATPLKTLCTLDASCVYTQIFLRL